MAVNPIIRGKNNVLKHFEKTKHCFWKLYDANTPKAPIQSYIDFKKKNITDAHAALDDILEVMEPTNVYILDSWAPTGDEKDLLRPEASMPFTLQESTTHRKQENDVYSMGSNYTPEFGAHIKLIEENARLKSELDYTSKKLADALEEVGILKNELNAANELIDQYEEEEEEEEEAMAGEGKHTPLDIEGAVAQLIANEGGNLIQGLFGKKSELKPEVTISDDSQAAMNGVINMPPLEHIVNELKKHDSKLHEHFFKLLMIAQQQPMMFKMLIGKIDSF